jgi:hypothetical protein
MVSTSVLRNSLGGYWLITVTDTWMMPFGDLYVENYTQEAKGHLAIDLVQGSLPN